MSRRALSPAARGVLLAVSAALRGRVASITDGADGTTTATVVEPDGTVLLDVRVRAPSSRRDTRQIALPLAPGPRHEPPAPVAVVPQRAEASAPQGDPTRIRGLALGDVIDFDEEGPCAIDVIDDEHMELVARDSGAILSVTWSEVTEVAPGRWAVLPVRQETPAQQRASKRTAPNRTGRARPARLIAEPAADRLCAPGHQVIVWQQTPTSSWEVLLSRVSGPAKALRDTWAQASQGHRAREYNRSGKCVRDSRDEGGAS